MRRLQTCKCTPIKVVLAALVGTSATTSSWAVDLNYENLSFVEEPLAIELGDTTFLLNGLVDIAARDSDLSDDNALLTNSIQLTAETQLRNSWTLGASYFASYVSGQESSDDFVDNGAVFLGGVWGTVAAGNVSGLVREQTRRIRGTGNAVLNFDSELLALSDTGVSYLTRFGPTQIIATIDDDSHYAIGINFQRPMGNKDYRFALRWQDTSAEVLESVAPIDSQSLVLIAELTYGSTVVDASVGVEKLSTLQNRADRRYVSVGATRKWNAWTGSASAHVGEIEGQNETSYALGLRYDISRGLSLNLGLNHSDAVIDALGFELLNQNDTEATASLRYSY